jgi:hypothetical protein
MVRNGEVIGRCDDFSESRDAWIAGRTADRVAFLRKAPCECVLTAAASYDKYFHAVITLEQPV